MQLTIRGEYTSYEASGFYAHLESLEIQASVYSKNQARAEFERFLNVTGLPDLTGRERDKLRKEEEAKAKEIESA